jgi:hypothetical protein
MEKFIHGVLEIRGSLAMEINLISTFLEKLPLLMRKFDQLAVEELILPY